MALLQPIKTSSTSFLLGLSFFVVFIACYCCCCATTTCAFVTVPGILLTTTTTNTRDNNNNNPTPVAPTVGVGSTSTAADDDVIHTHDWREVSVQIPKPLGLIIEEVDATDPSQGVEIVQIARDGNTAATNRQKQQQPRKTITNTTDDATMKVVCVGDRIRVVNGVKCSTYDEVMDQIVFSSLQHLIIDFILGRPSDRQCGGTIPIPAGVIIIIIDIDNGGWWCQWCLCGRPTGRLLREYITIDRCGIYEQSLSLLLRTTQQQRRPMEKQQSNININININNDNNATARP